jgi:hypothetical protein
MSSTFSARVLFGFVIPDQVSHGSASGNRKTDFFTVGSTVCEFLAAKPCNSTQRRKTSLPLVSSEKHAAQGGEKLRKKSSLN